MIKALFSVVSGAVGAVPTKLLLGIGAPVLLALGLWLGNWWGDDSEQVAQLQKQLGAEQVAAESARKAAKTLMGELAKRGKVNQALQGELDALRARTVIEEKELNEAIQNEPDFMEACGNRDVPAGMRVRWSAANRYHNRDPTDRARFVVAY